MNSIGHRLKEIRLSKNMTQQDLVSENITKGLISLVENGKSNLSVEKFRELSYKLNLSPKEIGVLVINNQSLSQTQLGLSLDEAILHNDQYMFNLLLQQESRLFEQSNNIRHSHNMDFYSVTPLSIKGNSKY